MRKKVKRILALLLAIGLAVSVTSGMALSASSEEGADPASSATEEVVQEEPVDTTLEEPADEPAAEEEEQEEQDVPEEADPEPAAEEEEQGEPASAGEAFDQTMTVGSGDKTVKVRTTAEAGVLPEGATLVVKQFEDTDSQYQEAADQLDANEIAYDGLLALDVGFEVNGQEVEPTGSVDVQFELGAGFLPEDADTDSLAVQHLADTGVETVADTGSVTDGTITVQDQKVNADFTVDSFSYFTITYNKSSITVYCVDAKGNPIPDDKTSKIELLQATATTDWTNIADYAPAIDGYTYGSAHVGTADGTAFTKIRYKNSKWQYRNGSSDGSHDFNGSSIYLVYGENLEEVATIDSTSKGVQMQMYNFEDDDFAFGDSYGDNDCGRNPGLLSKTIANGDEFPIMYKYNSNTSLGSLGEKFKNGTTVNHLFLESVYNEEGYFYYSSADNFAELNGNEFTVYKQLGTPSREEKFYYKRGNFMPYNHLDSSVIRNRNLYDYLGNALTTADSRYNEPLYGFKENNEFQFGMYLKTDFLQPKNGQVNGKDMVFEFTGDDDMWVYIDGVLVLDLGGIHDALSGSINFSTGVVRYQTKSGNNYEQTTLKELFKDAGVTADFVGNTFANYSSHTMQMFYMERGAGASNLRVKFNLQTIPTDSINVVKGVENLNSVLASEQEYTMQLFVNDTVQANTNYTVNGVTHTTGADGTFKLKADETATFSNIPANATYYVKELDTGNYDVSFNDDSTSISADLNGAVTSSRYSADGQKTVVVHNKARSGQVTVTKSFAIGDTTIAAPEGFSATFSLYKADENGAKTGSSLASATYAEFTNGSYTFQNLLPGSYIVEETNINGGTTSTVQYVGNKTNSSSVVTVTAGNTAGTSITNEYEYTNRDLTITKTVGGNMGDTNKEFEFTLMLTKGNDAYTDNLSYSKNDGTTETLRANNSAYTFSMKHGDSVTISIPAGYTYTVTEDRGEYTAKYKVDNGENQNGNSATGTLTEDTTIAFTNTKNVEVPNGLTHNITPYIIMVVLAAGAGVYFVMRRRPRGRHSR